MSGLEDLFKACWLDPQFESEHMSMRPLRGVQAEIIKRVENFVEAHEGGVMTILSSRQTGKNEVSAVLQRRHLWRRQNSRHVASWIRTAPTYAPQIVNSKKRLTEILQLSEKGEIRHPSFLGAALRRSEGYIWQVGNATVEFLSSGKNANVVGATASECLDMDEAHKIDKAKFDEDFAPFTASTNAGTLLWGVAGDGHDTIEAYRQTNIAEKRDELNLYYPCEVWMDVSDIYRAHVENRVKALGWDHPIIKTQYRLLPVSQEGTFISKTQAQNMFSGEHDRELKPRPGVSYEMLIDIAAGNEDFNPDQALGAEDEDQVTATDSTIIWIYEVTEDLCANNLFPVLRIRDLNWWTGVPLPKQEQEIVKLIEHWKVQKVTVDAVGVGRQIAEALETKFGPFTVKKYTATRTSISEDCFDLLARLNYGGVLMFGDDGSPEYQQFTKQVGWTKYSSALGQITLIKPKADMHIDMVKGLTYINQNKPEMTIHQILSAELT